MHDAEKRLNEVEKPKSKPKSSLNLKSTEDTMAYIKEKVDLFATMGQNDSLHDAQFVSEVTGGVIATFVTLVSIIAALAGPSSPAPRPLRRKKATNRPRKHICWLGLAFLLFGIRFRGLSL